MVIRPNWHFDKAVSMNVLGQNTTISKATAPEILAQLKPKIIEAVLQILETADPTPHKEYTQWIAARYITGDTKLEDVGSTLAEYLHKFNVLKRKKILKPPANDINKYNSFGNFMDNMDEYELPEDEVRNKGKSHVILDNEQLRIIVPDDMEAAIYYGQGTRWCTAATKGSNYFDRYHDDGDLYILLPKKPQYEGEKYQLHFVSSQFMDPNDDPVDMMWILQQRFGDLVPLFQQIDPELKDMVMFASDKVLQPLMEKLSEAIKEHSWEIISDWEMSDEYYWDYLRSNPDYVYPEGHEDEGSIDWDAVADAGESYSEWNDEASQFVNDLERLSRQTPDDIRSAAQNVYDNGEDDGDAVKINHLEYVYAYLIRDYGGVSNRRRRDGGIYANLADWVDETLAIRPSKETHELKVFRIATIKGNREYREI
jgi:hypothetical protein